MSDVLNKADLLVDASYAELEKVLDFVSDAARGACFSKESTAELAIAVEEIFTNICKYAYEDVDGEARIICLAEPGQIRVDLIDSGKAFDPTAHADPDANLATKDRKPGGLGVFIAKKLVMSMTYERVDGQNRLTLIKEG
ncbi:MAG: ATP-binding protein [Raoultibacter sp.]